MSRISKRIDTVITSCLRMNHVHREVRDGRFVWIKRRRMGSHVPLHAANMFFSVTHARARIVKGAVWQQWETDCFRRLYGDHLDAGPEARNAVWACDTPGTSLCNLLKHDRLDEAAVAAAGHELRRAHQVWFPQFDGPWSHGDLQMENVLYDAASDRARLIDFETMHEASLPAEERHADDLLVLLLDLAGQVQSEFWPSLSGHFVDAYGRTEVLSVLKRRLVPPRGPARVWWAFRTSYLPTGELWRRLDLLKGSLP